MRFKKTLGHTIFTLMICISGTMLAGEFNMVINLGDPMPDFIDLPTTGDGSLSASELEESVVVLVSLANHCPWVKGMDSGLVGLVEQFEGQDVRIVGFAVNHREDDRLPAMKEHARQNGYNFTYLYDESQQLGRELGATRTPEYFVFNADRKLTYMGLLTNSPARKTRSGEISYINGDPVDFYAADAITATLAGEPADPAETRAHGCTVEYE
jgi:peroxiredoxin